METGDKQDKKSIMLEKLKKQQSEAKVVRKVVTIIAISLFLIAGVVIGGGYVYINSALKPADPGNKKEKVVEIPIGSGITTISQILEKNGIIKNARVFKYYVKFKNESGFMAGEYALNPAMTHQQIINSLKTGKYMEKAKIKLTIPEGKQLTEIADIIAKNTDYSRDEVLTKLNDRTYLEQLISQYPNLLTDEILNGKIKYPLEGYLFPATYSFYKENPTMEEIVNEMLDKTDSVVNEYRIQLEEQNMSVHQLLTLASLIEEEATEKVDRDKIASVFYNRLDAGMPLQTDPTVLYAKGEHQKRVYYKDLEVDDPYNTYKYPGLTPSPIANAGTTSIDAALAPAETDYLYFLATPEGEVLFSKTHEEHEEKVAEHITGS